MKAKTKQRDIFFSCSKSGLPKGREFRIIYFWNYDCSRDLFLGVEEFAWVVKITIWHFTPVVFLEHIMSSYKREKKWLAKNKLEGFQLYFHAWSIKSKSNWKSVPQTKTKWDAYKDFSILQPEGIYNSHSFV